MHAKDADRKQLSDYRVAVDIRINQEMPKQDIGRNRQVHRQLRSDMTTRTEFWHRCLKCRYCSFRACSARDAANADDAGRAA